MKKRILSLALAVMMMALLVPMMSASANISAANRGIVFPYMFSASPGNLDWSGGFNQITAPFLEFDVTRNGTYVLELPPWLRNDTLWVENNAKVLYLQPAPAPSNALSVTVESIAVNGTDRITNGAFAAGGAFWNNDTGTYFGNLQLPGGLTYGSPPVWADAEIPGFTVREHSVPVTRAVPALQIAPGGQWDPFVGTSALGTISQGAIVTITIRVGTGGPVTVFGDANGDGVIDAADVTIVRRYIAAADKEAFLSDNPSFRPDNADANDDGFINSADVTLIRRYVAATNKDSVVFGAPPPTLSGSVTLLTNARVGVPIMPSTGGLNVTTGLTYQWQRTGTGLNESWSNIPAANGGTSETYTPVSGDLDRRLRVEVRSANALGGPVVSNQTNRVITPPAQNWQYLMAITLDDGPNETFTPRVLDYFSNAQGTGLNQRTEVAGGTVSPAYVSFYVNGGKINSDTTPLLQRMIREGHSIENHSQSHPNFSGLTQAQARAEIADTTAAIMNATRNVTDINGVTHPNGVRPFSFRAPFFDWGSPATNLAALQDELGLAFHGAGIDPDDWRANHTAQNIATFIIGGRNTSLCNCTGQAANDCVIRNSSYSGSANGNAHGGVVLMHDTTQRMVDSLSRFIPQLQGAGYRFVTIEQLHELRNSPPQRFTGPSMWPNANAWVPARPTSQW
jgi:peptidoglycan/xylan/chitin deacetylase (PgdA/CDA1 family)